MQLTEIEYKGKWKLPEDKEWLNGTLTYNPESGSKLELFGTFNPSFLDRSDKNIIIGKTNVGDVTLIDNWYRGKKVTHNSVTIGTYQPSKIIKGHHFISESDVKFEKAIFRVFNLFQWIAKTGQEHNFRNESSSYSLHYEEIPKIEFKINEECHGYISFDAPITLNKDYNSVDFKEESYIHLYYSKQVHYTRIIDDVIKFVYLITLFSFEQSYPIEITLLDSNYLNNTQKFKTEKYIKCIFQSSLYKKKHKLTHEGNHIVRYTEIEGRLPQIIPNWFNLFEKNEPVIMLMLNHFKNKYWFTSDKFMDSVRALESYHRQNYNNERIPKKKFDELKKEILEQLKLNEDDLKWLKGRLIGNEPHLSNRLKELVKENQNEFIIEKITDLNKYCHKVTSSRNYYTHYSKELEKRALKGSKLSELTRLNRGLLFSCILSELGIENKYFEKALIYNLG